MSKQLLFCVEANKDSRSDWVYIEETIKHNFLITPDISIKPIFMNGKTNYNKPKVTREIKSKTSQFRKNGSTTVIYCIDTDKYDIDPDRARELDEIQEYCNKHNYELVWFCRDIEEVYWGKHAAHSEKLTLARQFKSTSRIEKIDDYLLKTDSLHRKRSNILSVLNGLLSSDQCNRK